MDPSIETHLTWERGERFSGNVDAAAVVLDGNSGSELSPMQAIAAGLAGCMAIDIVMILQKGRQPLAGLQIHLTGERSADPPRRFTHIELHFRVLGDVDPSKVERAIDLSRETYCSVWHSLRTDIVLKTSYEILPAESSNLG